MEKETKTTLHILIKALCKVFWSITHRKLSVFLVKNVGGPQNTVKTHVSHY